MQLLKQLVILGLVITLSLGAVACGRSAEPEGAAKPGVSQEGDKIKIKGDQGEIVIDPEGAELPDEWPSDLPSFPKAKVTNTIVGAGAANMLMAVFETGKSVAQVKDFYAEQLPENGWEVTYQAEVGSGSVIITAKKDARVASVSAAKDPEGGKTIISINLAAQ